MKHDLEPLKSHMRKNKITPPDKIIVDDEWHPIIDPGASGPEHCGYIVNKGEPHFALYKSLERGITKRWESDRFKSMSASKKAQYDDVITKMRKKRDEALSVPQTAIGDKVLEPAPAVLAQVPQAKGIELDDDTIVAQLSQLTPFAFDRVRSKWAAHMKVRPCVLEKAVKKARTLSLSASFKTEAGHVAAQQQLLDFSAKACSPE